MAAKPTPEAAGPGHAPAPRGPSRLLGAAAVAAAALYALWLAALVVLAAIQKAS